MEFDRWIPPKLASALSPDLLATLILIVFVLIVRLALGRVIRRTHWAHPELKLRWRSQTHLLIMILLAFGFLLIWGKELQTLALSLVAVAVALVIATKELIACVMGSLFRFGSRAFSVGDRVEIGGLRGDVVDTGLIATKLLETGPAHDRTGRLVAVPNSLLLTERVINETFSDDLVLHVFPVPLSEGADWQHAEQALLRAARDATAQYREKMRDSLSRLGKQHHLEEQDAPPEAGEPAILVRIADKGLIELIARVPTPVRDKGLVEQLILRRYLSQLHADAAPKATSELPTPSP